MLAALWEMRMRSGLVSHSDATSATDSGMVAVNRQTCGRQGGSREIQGEFADEGEHTHLHLHILPM